VTRVDERVEPLNVEERTFRMKVVQRVWVWGDAETSICTVPGVNRKGQATNFRAPFSKKKRVAIN